MILLLVAVISLFLLFFVYSLSSCIICINTILNANEFFSPFFSWYISSMLSLICKVLCIFINFLVFCSICQSSSHLHLKNSPEYISRRTAQVFIPLMRFLLQSLVSSCLLILLRNSLLIVSFIPVCLMVSTYNVLNYLDFFFLKCSDAFLIWSFYFLYCFSFLFFHYQHETFFNAKFHYKILAVYSRTLY